jgi:hypothetical protein
LDAGVRKVPVHPVILPIVRSLVASVDGSQLIPGPLPSGRDQKRSFLMLTRLGWHLREALDMTDPSAPGWQPPHHLALRPTRVTLNSVPDRCHSTFTQRRFLMLDRGGLTVR